MRKIIEIIFGIFLVLIGLVGGIIPIFQGWVFGIPGLLLLSKHFPPIKKMVDKLKNKLKKYFI